MRSCKVCGRKHFIVYLGFEWGSKETRCKWVTGKVILTRFPFSDVLSFSCTEWAHVDWPSVWMGPLASASVTLTYGKRGQLLDSSVLGRRASGSASLQLCGLCQAPTSLSLSLLVCPVGMITPSLSGLHADSWGCLQGLCFSAGCQCPAALLLGGKPGTHKDNTYLLVKETADRGASGITSSQLAPSFSHWEKQRAVLCETSGVTGMDMCPQGNAVGTLRPQVCAGSPAAPHPQGRSSPPSGPHPDSAPQELPGQRTAPAAPSTLWRRWPMLTLLSSNHSCRVCFQGATHRTKQQPD